MVTLGSYFGKLVHGLSIFYDFYESGWLKLDFGAFWVILADPDLVVHGPSVFYDFYESRWLKLDFGRSVVALGS